ncbi:MAG: hypothetical protein ACOX2O_01085 [Bdellovibrionota bacterium]
MGEELMLGVGRDSEINGGSKIRFEDAVMPSIRFEEVVMKLGNLREGFANIERSMHEIFKEGGLLRENKAIPEGSVAVKKIAASAAILSNQIEEQINTPGAIEIGVQIAKIGKVGEEKFRFCFPGGGVLSDQELAWIKANPNREAPQNLFYILAQEQLKNMGKLCFTYNNMEGEGCSAFLKKLQENLERELSEEMGKDVEKLVRIKKFLSEERETVLTAMGLPDSVIAREIAEKLQDRGVTQDEKGTLHGIYTTVIERIAVAESDQLWRIAARSGSNEEQRGMTVKTLKELLEIGERSAENLKAYLNYDIVHCDQYEKDGGVSGFRNPSFAWGLKQVVAYLENSVKEADPYKEGARRQR